MWIFLNNAFLSIVEDYNDPSGETLHIRARFKGDIEQVFNKPAIETPRTDYRYRISLPRAEVNEAISHYIQNELVYDNFKNSISPDDYARASAYVKVWLAMLRAQEEES